jgi:DNA-binding response OmpR family regulator
MKTILLIEDNKDVRENTAEILELSNYKVLTAEDGKKGVAIATKEKPDLIICDIMMPVLDGYSALHLLSKNKETANIPFIFLTAKTERSDLRKGMEMGADDYLTKPFDDVELLQAIETRLKRTDALKHDYENSIEGVNEFLEQAKKIHDLKLISTDREIRTYSRRQLIYEEGTRPAWLFFINKGTVKLYRRNDDGKELITSILKNGEFFGYGPLLEEKLYADTAEALEESEIMIIPKKEFDELINHDHQVMTQFVKLLANKLSGKEDELVRLAYNSVRKRVADALLLVYDRYNNPEKDQPALKITREDLARIVGTATESLIRTLSDFRGEKLVAINDGKISILNAEKLKQMAN